MIFSKPNTAAAAKTLAQAEAALVAAETEAEAAEAAYRDSLTEAELPELERLAQRKLSATVAIDRARAVLEAAQIRHTAAVEADAEAGRQARYDAAAKLSEAAAKRLKRDYAKHALAIRELLRELAEAESAVQSANAELPEGGAQLEGPEADRSTRTQYRETVSTDVVELWATIDSVQPIPDEMQARVSPYTGRRHRGLITDREDSDETPLAYGVVRNEYGGAIDVVRKLFRRTTFLPDVSGRFISPLANEINLPPLEAGASAFWQPTSGGPRWVLSEIEKPVNPRPAEPKRLTQVEYERVYQRHNLDEAA